MKRFTAMALLSALATAMGMSADGCLSLPGPFLGERRPPAIIPTSPIDDSLTWSFSVDLRRFPDARSVTWDFGDGGVMTAMPAGKGRFVTHVFTGPGVFNVTVHVFGPSDPVNHLPGMLLGTGVLPVEVIGPNVEPTAQVVMQEVTDSEGVVLSAVRRFDASRSRDPDGFIEAFMWDFGDGATAEGPIVEHTYARTGRFTVRLTVRDSRGATAETSRTVVINLRPAAVFTFSEISADGLQFRFDAGNSNDPDGNLVQFRWDFGDGSPEAFGAVVTHTYAVPDDYTVALRVTDDQGAVATATQIVNVTGVVPFIRSALPDFGVVDTTVADVSIDGENFEDGATAELRQGATIIPATTVNRLNDTTLQLSFDLAGAPLGTFDLVIENPVGGTATLAAAFRVVTPNRVRLVTSLGDIVIETVNDAPVTTDNFFQYVVDDFYDGTIFHRVVPGFVVQGGGFLPGLIPQTGARPPIVNEFSPTRSNVRGTVAMAKVGGDPDSATSEFFFNLADNSANLDNQNGGFTVFANVVDGLDVVDAIAAVPLNGETPVDDVLLIRAERE